MANEKENGTVMSYNQLVISQSLEILEWSNSGPTQITIINGFVSIYCAICIIVTIILSKKLTHKSYVFIALIALGDILMAATTVSIAIRRMIAYHTGSHTVVNQFQCLLEDSWRLFAAVIVLSFLFSAALDRFIAVVKPQWYSAYYPKYLFQVIIFFNFVQAGILTYSLFLGSDEKILIPVCAFYIATTQNIIFWITVYSQFTTVAVTVTQLAAIITVYVRLGKVRKTGGNVCQAKNEMQVKVVTTLSIMLVSYLITVAAAAICFKYFLLVGMEFMLKYNVIINLMNMLNPIFNFSILMWKNDDFRTSYARIIRICFQNKVRAQ